MKQATSGPCWRTPLRGRANAVGHGSEDGHPQTWGVAVAALALWVSMEVGNLQAQSPADYFRQNCVSCHTIGGGRLTGPDLKNVTQRQDRDWLASYLLNPSAAIDRGDPYALKLLEESRGVTMPTPPGITRDRAQEILDLIEQESQLEESQFKGLQVSNEPFTDADRTNGREIFLGFRRLAGGGPACFSCHSMHDTPALGGGWLGVDLTNVYERLEGRKTLSAWLMAPATQTMQPVFRDRPLTSDEIHVLVAYFEASAGESPAQPLTSRIAFLLLGLVGAAGLVFAMDAIWSRRFHSVRRPLVDASPLRGH